MRESASNSTLCQICPGSAETLDESLDRHWSFGPHPIERLARSQSVSHGCFGVHRPRSRGHGLYGVHRDSSRAPESSGIHGFSGTHRLFGATGLYGVHEFSGTHRDHALYGIPSGKPASSSELQDLRVLRKGALTWKPRLPSVFRYPACSTSSSQCSNSLTRCLAPRWSRSVDPKT
jgi:hypothetical protein